MYFTNRCSTDKPMTNEHLRGKLVISAPFGNYNFFSPGGDAVMTMGTFTRHRRAGWPKRIWKIISTVRYRRKTGAWVNKLGLPSPGIHWMCQRFEEDCSQFEGKIISIKGFTDQDWYEMGCMLRYRAKRVRFAGIELNMSCPNVEAGESIGDLGYVMDMAESLLSDVVPVIVKLPPVDYMPIFLEAYERGIRTFHCCNTLSVPEGGMSGKPLKPLALDAVSKIRAICDKKRDRNKVVIIGGGGIVQPIDAHDFFRAGADSVAMASALFLKSGRLAAKRLVRLMEMHRGKD